MKNGSVKYMVIFREKKQMETVREHPSQKNMPCDWKMLDGLSQFPFIEHVYV